VRRRRSEAGSAKTESITSAPLTGRAALATVAISAEMPRGLVRVDGVPRAKDFPEGIGLNVLASGATSDLGDGNVLYSARVDVLPA